MINQISFAIQMTYKCPLACSHCCFSASPENKYVLSKNHILRTIKYLDTSTIKGLAFTGGEPFLFYQTLKDAIRYANQRGFTTRVVTSAYFGGDLLEAERMLKELRDLGLNEISISWDDFHSEYLGFNCINNVFHISKKLGLTVGINIVRTDDSYWTAERVKKELGINNPSSDIILESPLNLTGRAETKIKYIKNKKFTDRFLGPCPYVMTGPTLSAKNKLLACCGVIPETDELILDHNFKPENLHNIVKKSTKSSLLNWLYLRGPYAIIEWISKRYDINIPDRKDIGGNCEACRLLFHTDEFRDRIPSALAEKRNEISGELHLLDTLGLLEPTKIMNLWKSNSEIAEIKPLPSN